MTVQGDGKVRKEYAKLALKLDPEHHAEVHGHDRRGGSPEMTP